jgi:hypothetical protein
VVEGELRAIGFIEEIPLSQARTVGILAFFFTVIRIIIFGSDRVLRGSYG